MKTTLNKEQKTYCNSLTSNKKRKQQKAEFLIQNAINFTNVINNIDVIIDEV